MRGTTPRGLRVPATDRVTHSATVSSVSSVSSDSTDSATHRATERKTPCGFW